MKSVTYQGYKNMEVCEVNDPTEIITHTMLLEDIKEAYNIFNQKKDNTIKAVSYTHLTLPTICSV